MLLVSPTEPPGLSHTEIRAASVGRRPNVCAGMAREGSADSRVVVVRRAPAAVQVAIDATSAVGPRIRNGHPIGQPRKRGSGTARILVPAVITARLFWRCYQIQRLDWGFSPNFILELR
jgi:hypothetical protein